MSDLVLREREDWVKSWKDGEAQNGADFEIEPLRKGFASKVRKVDEEKRSFEIVISSEAEDRDGDVITLKGWILKNFRKNPVVQWAHNHHMPAIARSIKITSEDNFLVGEPQFPTEGVHPFADMIFNLFREKILNASSVGFMPKEFEPLDPEDNSFFAPIRFLKQELLEFSLVNVPSNPEALGRAKSLGINIAPLREWAIKVLDGEGGEGGLWLPRSKVERALQIVENDRTAIAMNGYKLIPATKDNEAIVVIEVPIPKDVQLDATELDKRLSHGVIEETISNVTNDIMAEPEEETIAATADENGVIDKISLAVVTCSHCDSVHSDLLFERLHKDENDFWTLCPDTLKPITISLDDYLKTADVDKTATVAVTIDSEGRVIDVEDSKNKKDKGDDDVTFETADGEQLLEAFLESPDESGKKSVEPDDFVKSVGNIIKSAIGQSTKEAVREHLTSVTGKLD